MAKLIPGKIRTEGINLAEAGKIKILEARDSFIRSVDEQNLQYSLNDAIFVLAFSKEKNTVLI